MRPHRRQPTRLPHPWDSPGKNTGVACHFLLQCKKVKSESEVTQSCRTLSDPMDRSPPGSSVHGIFQARVLEWGAIACSAKGLQGRTVSDSLLPMPPSRFPAHSLLHNLSSSFHSAPYWARLLLHLSRNNINSTFLCTT